MKRNAVCKCCLFILLLFGALPGANAQHTLINLRLNNVTVEEVINKIEDQSDYRFLYNKGMVDVTTKVSIAVQNENIKAVLDKVFQKSGITWLIKGKQIVLNKAEHPQGRIITGLVTDKHGEPVIGAAIMEKGTTKGTVTDMDGKFKLDAYPDATLIISYLGYKTQEIAIENRTNINVLMEENAKLLDEIVVVGYGTQKKVNLTGAITQITAEEMKDRPVTKMSQALQGIVPNLNIVFGSGQPGTSGRLNIRGTTSINGGSPLVLIDGVPGNIDRINVNDVESISVLKDASASAVYGARAAFGVILVTTKNAKEGKFRINYQNNFGWTTHNTNTDFITSGY